jgi:hypothetical protein
MTTANLNVSGTSVEEIKNNARVLIDMADAAVADADCVKWIDKVHELVGNKKHLRKNPLMLEIIGIETGSFQSDVVAVKTLLTTLISIL